MLNGYDKSTKKNDVTNKAQAVIKAYLSKDIMSTDPDGSYTGKAQDKYEKPVQDADDL